MITIEDLIRRYADDIAYVAQEPAASDLGTFINQLEVTVPRYSDAGINGHEDLETAAGHLNEACGNADESVRNAFLQRADELLYPIVWDMTQEYRDAVDD
ncbi:hypothetical protein [Streptomyces sp. URMC 123]|uniref:hypothetical protein n=1 Tax=Streptomyces sp. URMC 123 TaxID=3423403 RepID=UPI003F53402C